MRGLSTAQQTMRLSVASVEMTVSGWVEEKGTRVATLPSKMRGFFVRSE